VSSLYSARLQVKLAWRAAKYVIQHAPPPVVRGEDLRARVSGGAPAGGAIADQYAITGAVLDLQHSVAQTAIGMIDTAHGALRDSLSRTLFLALDQRDAAVAYVHSIDVPPPVGDDLLAHKSGGAVAGTWAT
jgi:ribosomal protein S9